MGLKDIFDYNRLVVRECESFFVEIEGKSIFLGLENEDVKLSKG